METYYIINGINKIATPDDFEEGCSMSGHQDHYISHTIKADTVKELISRFAAFVDVETKDIQAGEVEGNRLEAQRLENAEGFALTSAEFEQWKQGKIKAWLCDYSARVYLITEKAVDLTKEEL